MTINKIATLLSLIFIFSITAPIVLLTVDKSSEVSFLYTTSDEENTAQKVKIFEVLSETIVNQSVEFTQHKKQKNVWSKSKKHPNPYFNLIVPPPEYT